VEFSLGNRALNLEMAITAYEAALEVYTRSAFPTNWAITQNNLGNAYKDRIRGQRAINLERAIAAHEAALEVITREAFPEQWAITQNNLGVGYKNRICGEQAENLKRAIATYEKALQVGTREAFPEQWAMTQNNLGNAYRNLTRGERAENLKRAIAAHEAALEVITREAFPEQWAMIQGLLISAIVEKLQLTGGVEDLDAAITVLEDASQVAVPGTDSYVWIQLTLGNALEYRHSLHSALEDLAQATAAYHRAADTTPWPSDKGFYLSKAADSEYALGGGP
jgi:tetratricopeptide (TPR) repeat protein